MVTLIRRGSDEARWTDQHRAFCLEPRWGMTYRRDRPQTFRNKPSIQFYTIAAAELKHPDYAATDAVIILLPSHVYFSLRGSSTSMRMRAVKPAAAPKANLWERDSGNYFKLGTQYYLAGRFS